MGLMLKIIETARRVFSGRAYLEVRAGDDHQAGGALVLPPGFDGHPLPGDLSHAEKTTREGERVFTGAVDLLNPGKTEPGEGRIYARDSSGAPMCEVWCKADGTVVITLAPGKKLEVGGAGRKAVARNEDPVSIAAAFPPPPPSIPLDFFTWVGIVNGILVPLSGGTLPALPPVSISGAKVQASAQELETV